MPAFFGTRVGKPITVMRDDFHRIVILRQDLRVPLGRVLSARSRSWINFCSLDLLPQPSGGSPDRNKGHVFGAIDEIQCLVPVMRAGTPKIRPEKVIVE